MSDAPTFEEAIFITSVDTNILKSDADTNEIVSTTYMHYTPDGVYDVAYDIRYNKNSKKIQFRQTIKGSAARFISVIKMYYR